MEAEQSPRSIKQTTNLDKYQKKSMREEERSRDKKESENLEQRQTRMINN